MAGQPAAVGPPAVACPPALQGWPVLIRRWAVGALAVITSVAMVASVLAVWSYRQVLDTKVFVKRFEQISHETVVVSTLADYVGDEVLAVIDPPKLAARYLPADAQPLAGPLASAVESFVRSRAQDLLLSDRFQAFLRTAVTDLHHAAIRLLDGKRVAGFELHGDTIVFNTLPVIQQLLDRVSQAGLFGHPLSLPPISDRGGVPSAQIAALAGALGVALPPRFGQLTVFRSSDLSEAESALKLFRRGLVALLIATLLLLLATMVASRSRWRTMAQLGIGFSSGMLVARLVADRLDARAVAQVHTTQARSLVRALVAPFARNLALVCVVLAVVGLVVAIAGLLAGRSQLAATIWVAAKRSAERAGSAVARAPVAHAIIGHPDAARLVGIAVGLALLLWTELSLIGVIVALVVTAGLQVAVSVTIHRARRLARAPVDPAALSSQTSSRAP